MNMGNLLGSFMQSGFNQPRSGRVNSMLSQAARMVGGQQNLAVGGLGALAGALMGSRNGLGGAVRGGVGGGAVAMLGLMAYNALRASGSGGAQGPAQPYREPQTAAEHAELERHAELVLKAMINAAKADGTIDAEEMNRILGKVQEDGASAAELDYVRAELARPLDTAGLVAAARGKPELGAMLYAASLLAIQVDTPAEKEYLAQLAAQLGLAPGVTDQLHQGAGM